YRKVNPADAPVLILALTSDTIDKGQMYDAASSILQQKLAQTEGVGQVSVGGGALPAVRVDVNPTLLNSIGLGLEDIRQTLTSANANPPERTTSRPSIVAGRCCRHSRPRYLRSSRCRLFSTVQPRFGSRCTMWRSRWSCRSLWWSLWFSFS